MENYPQIALTPISNMRTSHHVEFDGCSLANGNSLVGGSMAFEAMHEDAYRAYRVRMELLLQIPTNASDQNIHELIEAGFLADRVRVLCELGTISPLQRDKIVPYKTLKSRLTLDQRLTLNESDRLFRVVHITAMTEVLFGNEVKARRWLAKPKERLSGKSPIEMLSTSHGTRVVEKMLIQVGEGYAF